MFEFRIGLDVRRRDFGEDRWRFKTFFTCIIRGNRMNYKFLINFFHLLLLNFLKNNSLDKENYDEDKAREDAAELTKKPSFTSDTFLELLKTSSKRQLKLVFESYETVCINFFLYLMLKLTMI